MDLPAPDARSLAPPRVAVAGAVSGAEALASLEEIVAIAGWMSRFSDRARAGRPEGRKVEEHRANRSV